MLLPPIAICHEYSRSQHMYTRNRKIGTIIKATKGCATRLDVFVNRRKDKHSEHTGMIRHSFANVQEIRLLRQLRWAVREGHTKSGGTVAWVALSPSCVGPVVACSLACELRGGLWACFLSPPKAWRAARGSVQETGWDSHRPHW